MFSFSIIHVQSLIFFNDNQGVGVLIVIECILGLKADVVLPRRSSRQCEESYSSSLGLFIGILLWRSLDPTDDICRLHDCLLHFHKSCSILIHPVISGVGEKDSLVTCARWIRCPQAGSPWRKSTQAYRSFTKGNSGTPLTCTSNVRRCLPLDHRYKAAQCPRSKVYYTRSVNYRSISLSSSVNVRNVWFYQHLAKFLQLLWTADFFR